MKTTKIFSFLFVCLFGSVQLVASMPSNVFFNSSHEDSMNEIVQKCPCGCNKGNKHNR